MITIKNLFENENIKVIDERDEIKILEHQQDLSVSHLDAINEYYAAKMNVKRRQLFIDMNNSAYVVSAGAMQWMTGGINMKSDVKGAGDFLSKALKGSVTNESAVKPLYEGTGQLMLEPTYRHLLIEDLSSWNNGVVLDDGLFLACEAHLKQSIKRRSNVSTALLGNEGIFNLQLTGEGLVVLESKVPRTELIEIYLDNDEIRIDGGLAIAWSSTLDFRVEKSTKGFVNSAISGEGFVNVYRGSGKILMAPTA